MDHRVSLISRDVLLPEGDAAGRVGGCACNPADLDEAEADPPSCGLRINLYQVAGTAAAIWSLRMIP